MIFEIVSGLCKNRSVSYSEVERSCDLTNGTISKLRTSMVSADKLKRLADYFGVSMEYLLTGSSGDIFPTSKEERKIIEAFRQADHGTRSAVLKLLDVSLSQLIEKISAS